MKILLTGHRGFIGSHLLTRLKKQNSVVGIDLKDGWDRHRLYNNQDLRDCELNEDFDLIVHLAGKSGVRESCDDPAGYWDNNVEVTKRLLERYPETRMLIASSSSAYEPWRNPYAATKYVAESIPHDNCTHMRFHTVYSESCPRKNMFFNKNV